MKLLYLLLASNICAFASHKADSPSSLRKRSKTAVDTGSHAPQVSLMSRTGSGQATGKNQFYNYNYKETCKDYCIGGTAGVCFATIVCCSLIRYLDNK